MKKHLHTVFFFFLSQFPVLAQNCDPVTPVFNIDLTGQPNGGWISPWIVRDGLCCSVTGSDKCIQFNITLDSASRGISFNIDSGAVPGGSMFYQVNCGPQQAVGQPICISGIGPHIITFCKPGHNSNKYSITSIGKPELSGSLNVSNTCNGYLVAGGLDSSSIQWTSVPNNPVYNSYLSCTSGCDSVIITPQGYPLPAFVDYQVCGTVTSGCLPINFCDTIRVNFVNDMAVTINPANPTICYGGTDVSITANASGGLMPYSYLWNTGDTSASVTKGPGTYYVRVTDQMNCSFAYDTVVVVALPSAITADAGLDGTFCLNDQTYLLNGNVSGASGGQWIGPGTFSPSSTVLNPLYSPSTSEILSGYSDLQLITTGNNNCPADTDNIHLSVYANPLPNISGPVQACVNETVQYVTPFASGNTYQWSITGGILLYVNLDTVTVRWTTVGNNQLTVLEMNSANCDSANSISVVVMPNPTPVLNGTLFVSNACNGYLVADGLDSSSVQWTSVPNNTVYNSYLSCTSGCDSVIITPQGYPLPSFVDYQVCGTVTSGCLPINFCDTIRVNFVNDLAVTINPSNPTICFGGTDATLTANGSGGLMPYSYLWNTGDTTVSVTKGPGTYYVRVTDQMNCSFVYDTVVVVALPSAITADAGLDGTLCLNDQSYPLNGNVSVASGGQWIGPGTFSPSSTVLNPLYSPSASEILNGYSDLQLITTGNNNCPADTDSIHLSVYTNPLPNISGAVQACVNETVQYVTPFASGNTYQWSITGGVLLNVNQDTVTVQWTTVGNNQLTVLETNNANCDSANSISVVVMPKPTPEITGSQMICNYANENYSVLNPVMGSNYIWSQSNGIFLDSSGTSITVEWQITGLGNISVLEMNSNGCDSSISIPVNIIGQPAPVIYGDDTVCSFQTSFYTTNPDSTHQFNWTVNNGNIISQNNNVIEVFWTGQDTGSISVNEINQNNCDSSVSIIVIINKKPVPLISGPAIICSDRITEYIVGGILPNETINWNIDGGIIQGSANGDTIHVIWQTQGIGELRVITTNQNGCDTMISYPVTVIDGAAPKLTGSDRPCVNDTCVYSVSFVEGHNYIWQVSHGTIIGAMESNHIVVIWQDEGSGVVTITEVTINGCDSSISMNVDVKPLPIPKWTGASIVCQNETNVFWSNTVSNDLFSWSLSGGQILNNNLQPTINCIWTDSGQYTLTLTEINQMGCKATIGIPIRVMPKPEVEISGNLHDCIKSNSSYIINELPGINYQYSIVGGVIKSNENGNLQVAWTSKGNNSLSVYAINNVTGCNSQNTINVIIDSLPKPVIYANNLSGCQPLDVSFHNNQYVSSYRYAWNFGEGSNSFDANPDHTYNTSGEFHVKVTVMNNSGCTDSAVGIVSVLPKPVSEFLIINSGEKVYAEFENISFANLSQGANVYSWDFGNGKLSNEFEPVFKYDKPGIYKINLEVSNIWGCRHSMSKTIEAIVPEEIFVPNTFTPNGDSQNDYFSVNYKNIANATIEIFNRWGEKIFESNDLNFKWDGFLMGRKVQHDLYIYKINAVGYYGTEITKTGSLNVLY